MRMKLNDSQATEDVGIVFPFFLDKLLYNRVVNANYRIKEQLLIGLIKKNDLIMIWCG